MCSLLFLYLRVCEITKTLDMCKLAKLMKCREANPNEESKDPIRFKLLALLTELAYVSQAHFQQAQYSVCLWYLLLYNASRI